TGRDGGGRRPRAAGGSAHRRGLTRLRTGDGPSRGAEQRRPVRRGGRAEPGVAARPVGAAPFTEWSGGPVEGSGRSDVHRAGFCFPPPGRGGIEVVVRT